MGRVKTVLSVVGRLIKGDPGGGAITTSEHAGPPGLDSLPLAGDRSIDVPIPATGREVSVGYRDEKNDTTVNPGESKLYARDGSGALVCSIYLESDGSITAEGPAATLTIRPDGGIKGENGSGYFELLSDGSLDVNGATITAAGQIITALGVNLDTHTHTQPNDGGGDTEQPTNPPTPGP